jgi:hypothetical protein
MGKVIFKISPIELSVRQKQSTLTIFLILNKISLIFNPIVVYYMQGFVVICLGKVVRGLIV